MSKINVRYAGKRKLIISCPPHSVISDLPPEQGGDGAGMTPVELFAGAIGACAALYVGRYLHTAGIVPDKASVDVDFEMAEGKPARVGKIVLSINVPDASLGPRKKAVIAAAKECILHNTLGSAPEVEFRVEGD